MKRKLLNFLLIITALTCCMSVLGACNAVSLNFSAIEENGETVAYEVIGSSASKKIKIPSAHDGKPVTAIGDYAFEEGAFLLVHLKSITIPESVTVIGSNAFRGCTKLTEINFNGTKKQWEDIDKGDNWNGETGVFNGNGRYVIKCADGEIRETAGEKEEAVFDL